MPIIPETIIPDMFLPQLRALREAIVSRILPCFEAIDSEAKEVERQIYRELCASAGEDADGGDLAEAATDAGIEHFQILGETRQIVINSLAVAIAHMFDQQKDLLCLPTLADAEPDDRERRKLFRKLLKRRGLDPRSFRHRSKLKELKLVANVAKHGEGESAKKLRDLRPELFTHPVLRHDPLHARLRPLSVNRTLLGADLFVEPADLTAYLDAAEEFWGFFLRGPDGPEGT